MPAGGVSAGSLCCTADSGTCICPDGYSCAGAGYPQTTAVCRTVGIRGGQQLTTSSQRQPATRHSKHQQLLSPPPVVVRTGSCAVCGWG